MSLKSSSFHIGVKNVRQSLLSEIMLRNFSHEFSIFLIDPQISQILNSIYLLSHFLHLGQKLKIFLIIFFELNWKEIFSFLNKRNSIPPKVFNDIFSVNSALFDFSFPYSWYSSWSRALWDLLVYLILILFFIRI
mgnify:CR=1 FL=1